MFVEHPVLSAALWSGAIFAFVWSLGVLGGALFRNETQPAHTDGSWIFGAVLFLSALWMLFGAVYFSGLLRHHIHLAFVHLSPLYAIGPLLYLYCRRIIFERMGPRRLWLHFAPCFIVFGLALPFYVQPAPVKEAMLAGDGGAYFTLLLLLNAGPKISTVLYLTISMPQLASALRESTTAAGALRTERRLLVLILIAAYLVLMVGLAGFALRSGALVRVSAGALPVLTFALFILAQSFPNTIHRMRENARRLRYEKSRIAGLDVEDVIARLQSSMEEEQAWADEDLSLQSLARQLDVGPHQLSQILNERLGKNFHQYVNEYRVRAARKLLLQEPDRNILSIAFAVGFNSRSAFHKAFRLFSGVNPRRYRERSVAETPAPPDR